MTKACCPGSFDPVTNGHLDIVTRASGLFESVVVAVTHNPSKKHVFSLEERMDMLREYTADVPGVEVTSFSGLLVDFCKQIGAPVIVKGLRAGDFEYEMQMAQMNARMGVETAFMVSSAEFAYLSSSLIREVCALGGPIDGLVPAGVVRRLEQRLRGS